MKPAYLVLTLCLVASPASAQNWAERMFEGKTSHDFGVVARGAKSEHRFVLENIFVEDVHIASVSASCGCTTPKIEKRWLKTREQGAIIAHYNTDRFYGTKGATLTVVFDKPYYQTVQLHVRGHIRSDIMLQPGHVSFGTVGKGESPTRNITVKYFGWDRNWRLKEIKNSPDYLSAKIVSGVRTSQGLTFDLEVALSGEAPVGYLNDVMVLAATDGKTISLPIEGRVVSDVSVSPTSLFIGPVRPGEVATRQVVLRGKAPFRILSAETEGDGFQVQVPPQDSPAKEFYVVPVTYTGCDVPGKAEGTIKFTTDLSKEPVVVSLSATTAQSDEP